MSRSTFVLSSCLLFLLLGPPIGAACFVWSMPALTNPSARDVSTLTMYVVIFGYWLGAMPALLSGLACSLGLLVLVRFKPSLTTTDRPLRRVMFALLGPTVIYLLQWAPGLYSSLLQPLLDGGLRPASVLSKSNAELLQFMLAFYIPILACGALVGYRLLPQLKP